MVQWFDKGRIYQQYISIKIMFELSNVLEHRVATIVDIVTEVESDLTFHFFVLTLHRVRSTCFFFFF